LIPCLVTRLVCCTLLYEQTCQDSLQGKCYYILEPKDLALDKSSPATPNKWPHIEQVSGFLTVVREIYGINMGLRHTLTNAAVRIFQNHTKQLHHIKEANSPLEGQGPFGRYVFLHSVLQKGPAAGVWSIEPLRGVT
jgi:hypothetical protein